MSKKKYQDWELYPFAVYYGTPINKLSDKKLLFGIIGHHECPMRMQALARRRLIDLGILVRFEKQWMTIRKRQGIISKRLDEKGEAHFMKDGEKVTLEANCEAVYIGTGQFGSFFIYRIVSGDMVFFYKGGYPLKFTKATIKATVQHGEYQDKKRTYLKRIKIV